MNSCFGPGHSDRYRSPSPPLLLTAPPTSDNAALAEVSTNNAAIVMMRKFKPNKNDQVSHGIGLVSHSQRPTSCLLESNETGGKKGQGHLDLYLVKQIAHSLQEYDLEKKIDLEIRMREATSKLVAASPRNTFSQSGSVLEAAKVYITSNQRISAYMRELQNKKADMRRRNAVEVPESEVCTGKVSISDIRIPLMWKEVDHFKNKGDSRKFAVFCLVRIGTEILDTALIRGVDRTMTDITFDNNLIFHKVPPNFELTVELYSHQVDDGHSMSSTPARLKKRINDSLSRTVGRKLMLALKDNDENLSESWEWDRSSAVNFDLIATSTLRLLEVHDDIKTHDLLSASTDNNKTGSSGHLPLFGHFCCRLAAQPDAVANEAMANYLTVLSVNKETGIEAVQPRMWCTLKAGQLLCWNSKDNFSFNDEPTLTITIDKNTGFSLERVTSGVLVQCRLRLINNTSGCRSGFMQEEYILFNSERNLTAWLHQCQKHIRDIVVWKHAAVKRMDVSRPAGCEQFVARPRLGSLYGQTVLRDNIPQNKPEMDKQHELDSLESKPSSFDTPLVPPRVGSERYDSSPNVKLRGRSSSFSLSNLILGSNDCLPTMQTFTSKQGKVKPSSDFYYYGSIASRNQNLKISQETLI